MLTGDPKTWMASAFEEPYPVYYRLKSILEIFKPQYFKDTPEVKYKEIRQGLQTFLKVCILVLIIAAVILENVFCDFDWISTSSGVTEAVGALNDLSA